MAVYLGFDTSNYTSSLAAFDSMSGQVISKKKLLKVREGERGLRQNEAVFQHTVNLPSLIDELFSEIRGKEISAISASVSPRGETGSYMPCFLVGSGMAQGLSSALNIPLCTTSHQTGHILAALYSADKLSLISESFIAFHVSGGTTEALLVSPDDENLIKTSIIAKTLDLNAGQVVDRVGLALGLSFPAGAELDRLAVKSQRDFRVKTALRGSDCCLSGLENLCLKMINEKEGKEDVSKFCIDYLSQTLEEMTFLLLEKYGQLPLLFSGGVMSNTIIKQRFTKQFGAFFASADLSSDNAVGTGIYGYLKEN